MLFSGPALLKLTSGDHEFIANNHSDVPTARLRDGFVRLVSGKDLHLQNTQKMFTKDSVCVNYKSFEELIQVFF